MIGRTGPRNLSAGSWLLSSVTSSRFGAALLAVGLLAGCTSSGDSAAPPPAPAPSCGTPVNGEMQGTGSLWALFFARAEDAGLVVHGKEAKIVWKIGGTGGIAFTTAGPSGAAAKLAWGPTGHGGSSWERPGTEYGTGWVFPSAGCWTVTATRDDGTSGALAFVVA